MLATHVRLIRQVAAAAPKLCFDSQCLRRYELDGKPNRQLGAAGAPRHCWGSPPQALHACAGLRSD